MRAAGEGKNEDLNSRQPKNSNDRILSVALPLQFSIRRVSQICLVSVNRPTNLKTRKTQDYESGVKPFEESSVSFL